MSLVLVLLPIVNTTTIPALLVLALWVRTHVTHTCTVQQRPSAGADTGDAMGIKVETCDRHGIGSIGNEEEETLI